MARDHRIKEMIKASKFFWRRKLNMSPWRRSSWFAKKAIEPLFFIK